jgi:hypothetical protein
MAKVLTVCPRIEAEKLPRLYMKSLSLFTHNSPLLNVP